MPQGIYVFLSSVSELFLDLGLLGLAPPLGQVFGGEPTVWSGASALKAGGDHHSLRRDF